MNSRLSHEIKAQALSLGFYCCGISQARDVDDVTAQQFRKWIGDGGNAGMAYMADNMEKRLCPQLLMPGTKSIISVALNYAPAKRMDNANLHIATYAYGKDYHDVMKKKLTTLADNLHFIPYYNSCSESNRNGCGNANCGKEYKGNAGYGNACNGRDSGNGDSGNDAGGNGDGKIHYRTFCDTAPVLERYWAEKAGLGWTGRSHQFIIPHAGSMFFLGELFVDVELEYDEPMENKCGKCRKCIEACPTGALTENGGIIASRCLSYQTIENRGELSDMAQHAMGNCFYGCERCLDACPWNIFQTPNDTPELQPSDDLLAMTNDRWETLTVERYRQLFKGSAVKRAKYEGLMRNIKAAWSQHAGHHDEE